MNKKGMTLVEIIISIALISIVLIFLFSLLVNVRDINSSSEVNTTYLINKALNPGEDAFQECYSFKYVIFKSKNLEKVKRMVNYPFGIKDESIIKCEMWTLCHTKDVAVLLYNIFVKGKILERNPKW